MRKFFLFLISLLIGSAIFVLIIKNIGWEKIELVFRVFSVKSGIVIFLLTILAVLVRAWRWKTILKSQGFNIPVFKVLEYYLSGNAITFFLPMVIFGGEIFRGYDLKEKYNMPWPKSIASVVIDRILELTIYTVAIILGLVFFIVYANALSNKMEIVISLAVFIIILFFSFFYFKSFKKESIVNFFLKKFKLKNYNGVDTAIEVEREIFKYFRPGKEAMWRGFGLSFLSESILLVRTFFLLLFLGKNIGILLAISIVAFSSLAVTLPIPAALGSHEAVQSFVFTALGLGASRGAAYVLVVRGAELAVALIGLIFFFRFGVQIFESILFRKIKKLVKGPSSGRSDASNKTSA